MSERRKQSLRWTAGCHFVRERMVHVKTGNRRTYNDDGRHRLEPDALLRIHVLHLASLVHRVLVLAVQHLHRRVLSEGAVHVLAPPARGADHQRSFLRIQEDPNCKE